MSDSFSYELPKELVAQRPLAEREKAKLLHARIDSDTKVNINDYTFSELPSLLKEGDLIVFNNTKVIPLRFFVAHNEREIELFMLKPQEDGVLWEALARPMKRCREGDVLQLSDGLRARIHGRTICGERLLIEPLLAEGSDSLVEEITRVGIMPIPPYIRGGRGDARDKLEYQTVFASVPGSAAASTAALHFNESLLEQLHECGIGIRFLTLHMGPASFMPIKEAGQPVVAPEFYSIPSATIDAIVRCKARGGRVIAVGTSCVRSLEDAAQLDAGIFEQAEERPPCSGETSLFITPGFDFKVVDLIVTNFHQPRSTHLQLVAAYTGAGSLRDIYQHGIDAEYRFLSYGDGMLLELM